MLIVLGSVGIDFSALAIFSGAVGVGIGFGLQKIVSNLVSGIILLADKSIKPGDVITVGDTFGWVDTMGARYTSVVSRDGREFLIPNEDFITQRVVNWSYLQRPVRHRRQVRRQLRQRPAPGARRWRLAAAASVARVLKEPEPTCHLLEFGESSLDFALRFWIRDPNDGLGTVRSPVMLALWDAFKRDGIEFPFPQRDVNVNRAGAGGGGARRGCSRTLTARLRQNGRRGLLGSNANSDAVFGMTPDMGSTRAAGAANGAGARFRVKGP